jgi:hypothetical protein
LREEVQKRFTKSNQTFEKIIIRHMENLISNTTRVVVPPEDNYGNYGEEWCKDGKAVIDVRYNFFGEEKFGSGSLFIAEDEVNFLFKMLRVRKSYILNVITEWYDDKYATKFGQETNHPEFEIDKTIETDSPRKCYQMVNTDNLSRDMMIDYIDTQTSYSTEEIEEMNDEELIKTYIRVYNIQLNK